MQNHFNYNNQLDDIMQMVNIQNHCQPLTNITNVNKVDKKLPPLRQRVKENSRLLPQRAIDIMTEWYDKHYEHPYPTYREFELLAERGAITVNQVKQWFVNVRRRTQNVFRKKRDSDKMKKSVPVKFTISELSQPTTPPQELKVQYEIQKDIHSQIRNYQESLANKSNDNNLNCYKTQQLNESSYNANKAPEQLNDSYSITNTTSNESISYESNSFSESPSASSNQNTQYTTNCNYYGYYPFYYNNSPLNSYYNQAYYPTTTSYQSTPSNASNSYSNSYETSPSYNYTSYNSIVENKIEPACSTPVSTVINANNSYYSNYYYNASNSYNSSNISQSY